MVCKLRSLFLKKFPLVKVAVAFSPLHILTSIMIPWLNQDYPITTTKNKTDHILSNMKNISTDSAMWQYWRNFIPEHNSQNKNAIQSRKLGTKQVKYRNELETKLTWIQLNTDSNKLLIKIKEKSLLRFKNKLLTSTWYTETSETETRKNKSWNSKTGARKRWNFNTRKLNLFN